MSDDNNENKSKSKTREKGRLSIKVNDDTAKGTYSNLAIVHNNDFEFVFDFVFVEPQRPQGHVVSRVLTNPRTAKRMLSGLKRLVDLYEERFGEIKVPEQTPKGTYH